jgi:SET domain-containing protein
MNWWIILLIVIIIIIIIIIILLKITNTEIFTEIEYVNPNIKIGVSQIGGRGIISNFKYKKEDIIEVCPAIKINSIEEDTRLNDYVFNLDDTYCMIGYGYCSMYNHSDNPNAIWEILNDHQIEIKATTDISIGEEILIDYGSSYWQTRDIIKN